MIEKIVLLTALIFATAALVVNINNRAMINRDADIYQILSDIDDCENNGATYDITRGRVSCIWSD